MSKGKKKSGLSPQVWVAIITTLGVIIVALFAFPPFQRLFDPTPSPTAVSANTPFPTVAFTLQPNSQTPSPTFTETLLPTATLTSTETFTPIPPSATLIPTTGSPTGMQVKITANITNGRAPLNVTLSAKDSFVRAPDGTIFECRKSGCRYVWYVYLNGEQFIEPQETNGTFELKLGKRGNYFVSVYVCHGADAPTCGRGAPHARFRLTNPKNPLY